MNARLLRKIIEKSGLKAIFSSSELDRISQVLFYFMLCSPETDLEVLERDDGQPGQSQPVDFNAPTPHVTLDFAPESAVSDE